MGNAESNNISLELNPATSVVDGGGEMNLYNLPAISDPQLLFPNIPNNSTTPPSSSSSGKLALEPEIVEIVGAIGQTVDAVRETMSGVHETVGAVREILGAIRELRDVVLLQQGELNQLRSEVIRLRHEPTSFVGLGIPENNNMDGFQDHGASSFPTTTTTTTTPAPYVYPASFVFATPATQESSDDMMCSDMPTPAPLFATTSTSIFSTPTSSSAPSIIFPPVSASAPITTTKPFVFNSLPPTNASDRFNFTALSSSDTPISPFSRPTNNPFPSTPTTPTKSTGTFASPFSKGPAAASPFRFGAGQLYTQVGTGSYRER